MYELTENGFTTITQERIRKYILKAQNEIIYAKPAFYKNEMKLLLEAAERGVTCNIYFDKGDTSVRRGFGEAEALKLLQKADELPPTFKYHLKERIRLAFLMVDNLTVLFAPNIKAFEDEEENIDFPNGIVCKGELEKDVIRLFVQELKGDDEPTKTMVINLGNVEEEEPELIQATVTVNKPEDPEEKQMELDVAVALLTANPPVQPEELQKTIIYSDNYRIMKVITKGTRLANKKISLQPFYEMIGVTPENAKFDWRVFKQEESEKLEKTTALYKNIDRIKKEYKERKLLFDAKEYGMIIDVTVVAEFKNRLEDARTAFLAQFTADNEEVKRLEQVLRESEEELWNVLYEHCRSNFDAFKAVLEKHMEYEKFLKQDTKRETFTAFIKETDYIHKTLGFPTWETIKDGISLKFNFFDISNEMLRDKDFDAILKKYNLVPRKYSSAYKKKKNYRTNG